MIVQNKHAMQALKGQQMVPTDGANRWWALVTADKN